MSCFMSKKNHAIFCKNPNCIGGRIETTMCGDSGYSNWTVLSDGEIEFKCHGCGKFGSTCCYGNNNEIKNFLVRCLSCGSEKWSSHIQDVDRDEEETHIVCDECGAKTYELTNIQ